MKLANRVVWSEGMFMSPQHLQQLDAFHERMSVARLEATTPYPWGVLSIEIDSAAVSGGELRLVQFAGVMPDGLPIVLGEDSELVSPSRAFGEHFPPTASSLAVYLCVPRQRETGAQFASVGADDGERARWRRALRTVADRAGGPSEVAVEFGLVNASIRFGDESRGDFTSLKIAELRRNDAGLFELDGGYVPPILRADASSWLMEQLGSLLSLLLVRQRKLAEATRQRDASAVEFMSADVTRYLLLSTLNASALILRHLTSAGETSPLGVYRDLIRFLGQLGTFGSTAMPPGAPRFNYADLRATFSGVFTQLRELLANVVVDNTVRVALQRGADGVYTGALDDERLLATRSYFLAIRSDRPEAELVEQLPRLAKIAAKSEIHQYVQAALPGVPITVNYRPPAQIAVRSGVVYFELDTRHAAWRNIIFDRAVAIYLPPSLTSGRLEIELLALPS